MPDSSGQELEFLDFVKGFTSKNTINVEEDLGFGYVRLRVTEAERRQAQQDIRSVEDVAVELVRNSRDAGATRIFVASQKEKNRWRHITVLDQGSGIPQPVQARIFESRVTSKVEQVLRDSYGVHGRGMALFSIKHSVKDIELVDSEEGRGSIFRVLIDLENLSERKDQSTWPQLTSDDGKPGATGPHNILRSLVEFTFEERPPMIYLGSNAEILATLCVEARELARNGILEGDGAAPLWHCLHSQREGKELASCAAEKLGISVSERNALRILDGEIEPIPSLNEMILGRMEEAGGNANAPSLRKKVNRAGDRLSRRLSRQDMDQLTEEVILSAEKVGGKYFMKAGDCRVKRSGNKLVITLSFDEE